MPTKYQTIADQLRVEIKAGKYAAATALPSEYAICQEYQASRQTVRQALSLLVREGLIERRQGSGSKILRSGSAGADQHGTVAVITTYISDYIFPAILRSVEEVLSANGYTPLIFSTQNQVDNERRILNSLLTMPISGILVEGSKTVLPNPNLDLYQRLLEADVPLVFLHSTYSNLPQVLSVTGDNWGGGRMLVEYLHGKGHRDIAGIFKSDDVQGLQRYEGYISALRDLGLPMDDRRVFWYDTAMKARVMAGEHFDRAQSALAGCTAVVCYNDEIANRLVAGLLDHGVAVPGDMAVVSFDNSHYSDLSPVPITSLSHGERNVGAMAAQLLLRRIRGETCRSETVHWVLEKKRSG